VPASTENPWLEAAAVLGLGFYLARVSAESLPGVRTAPQLVFLVLVGLVTSWFVKAGLDRISVRHRELGLLLIYVFWPRLSPAVAGAVGLLAVGSWLWRVRPLALPGYAIGPWLPEIGVGIAGLALYGSTLAPSVLPADAGEFQLVGSTLGLAHPPGYALYTLLAKLATLAPVGDPAGRVNALSVIFSALTLVLLARLVRQMAIPEGSSRGVYWAAILAAAALGGSPTFWVQATTANIRSLNGLLTAALLLLAMRYVQARTTRRLAVLAFVFGLAAGHHSSLILLALPIMLYVLLSDTSLLRNSARWLPALGAFVLSLLVLLYLPLRSAMAPAFDPVPVDSVARFFDHVLALGFRGDLFYIESWADLFERILVYGQILRLQFGNWLPWAMLTAMVSVIWHDWRLGILLAGVWVVNAFSAITYRAPQTVEYLIPSYVAMAATLGCGLRLVVARVPSRRRTGLLLSVISVLLVRQLLTPLPDMRAQHTDRSARAAAERLLRQAPRDALILSNWHSATPLWYLQMVEGQRPDLEVVYVYPEGDTDNAETWLRRINAAVLTRPVVVTNRFYAYESSELVFEPLGDAWLARLRPSEAPPGSATRVAMTLGERIRVEAVSAPDRGRPGDALHVDLYWRPTVRLDRDYAVFVQLVGPNGVVGQADRLQPTSTYAPGLMRSDSYQLPLLLQTLPGTYELIAGFYTSVPSGWERLTTTTGADTISLGRVVVSPGNRLAATRSPMSALFEGGYVLDGMDIDRSVAGWTRLYLHWSRMEATPGRALQVSAVGDEEQMLATATLPALARGQTAVTVLDMAGEPAMIHLSPSDGDTALRPLTAFRLPGAAALTLRLPVGSSRYVPLGGQMAYIGLGRRQTMVEPGQPLRVRPRILSHHPLDRDISLSVSVSGPEGAWESKSDGTPALGAIPTLKWLTGWQVTSLYRPVLPQDAAPGTVTVRLEGYDAFTLAPLAVLDERLAREGQGTYLLIGTAEVVAP
jgi:hypothetical protein